MLFFDDFGYEQFDQLASSLRRRGIATVRLCSGRPLRRTPFEKVTRALRDHWLYSRRFALGDPKAEALLGRGRLGRLNVVDTLVAETAAAALRLDNPRLQRLCRRALACVREPAGRLFDKFEANSLMAQAGLPVPRQILACDTTPAAAAEALGLPVVVKARIGLGGDGVRIADSAEAMAKAAKELDGAGGRGVFFQVHVPGASLGYGSVLGPDGPLLEHGFRVRGRQWECGPSAQVLLHDEPRLLQAGRKAVAALGCQGFAQIDFIEDAQGRQWLIDVNLRPWGNAFSLLCLDIDFAAAYAALIQGEAFRAPRRASPALDESQADVFPFALYEAARAGSLAGLARCAGQFASMCRRGPGPAYGVVVGAKASLLLLERLIGFGRLGRPRSQIRRQGVP